MEINDYIIPLIICFVIIFGIYKKTDIYDSFLSGAKDGAEALIKIFPNIIAVMVAINMLRASGFIDILSTIIAPVLKLIHMPAEVLPLALFRPLSGSGALSVTEDILKNFGADSKIGLTASVMMGSTETTFYTVALYFGTCGIKNIRHTIFAALMADAVGILASIAVTHIYFGF